MKLSKAIHDQLIALPYFRNYQAVSGTVHNVASHEDAVEDVLVSNSLVQSDFKELASSLGFTSVVHFRDALLRGEHHDSVPDNVYFTQPTGTHNSPDFVFKVDNTVVLLECKSSKNNAPMYNGGLPKDGYVYLFCSEKSNETTMYMGEDIVNSEQRKIIEEFERESEERVAAFNARLKSADYQGRGLAFYLRNMWTQSGGAKFSDYFKHSNRTLSEAKVEKLFNV